MTDRPDGSPAAARVDRLPTGSGGLGQIGDWLRQVGRNRKRKHRLSMAGESGGLWLEWAAGWPATPGLQGHRRTADRCRPYQPLERAMDSTEPE